ncbi:hypothetical protein [Vallitalea okinawensis]|uniref:hypothetical protein n=1 Tax=Vallitalea okinawensis TaxID=2078660 RepID=UPI000CFACB86|nr:hypothetical protein [Vallitalea okinawensis]
MNRKLKSYIKDAFEAPGTTRKKEFLMSINYPKATHMDFILRQVGFIRKRVWIVACIFLIAGLVGLYDYKGDGTLNIIWIVSSLLPFVALVAVTEIVRSMSYQMEELEMSCKHTYADVVLVRLCIVGGYNLVVLGLLLLLFLYKTDISMIPLGMYLVTPFLLTCSLSLLILNHIHSRDTIYVCAGMASFVSVINSLFTMRYFEVIVGRYLKLWSMLILILIIIIAKQTVKFIEKAGELQWNFTLTD